MMRGLGVAVIVLAAAFVVGGCTTSEPAGNGGGEENVPKTGGVSLKAYPVAGDWEPVGMPVRYPATAAELDTYVGESRGVELRANTLDTLLVKTYAHHGWDKEVDKDGKLKPDTRRIRVELYIHQMTVGAGKTFQQWHKGSTISDVGEKAYAEQDSIGFLRGAVLIRLVPMGPWAPKSAGEPTIRIAKAIDAWIQGK